MKIQKIDNTNFGARKFRVPVKVERYERGRNNSIDIRTVSGRWVEEYSNPDAEELFMQAQKTDSISEKLNLLRQMGHPELKDISLQARLKGWYEDKVLKRILKDEW